MSGFAITRGCGFQVTFDNGYTVSVQFGSRHYCARHETAASLGASADTTCEDAEIAAFNADGDWYRPEDWGDDVQGWQTPAQVLAFMQEVAAL